MWDAGRALGWAATMIDASLSLQISGVSHCRKILERLASWVSRPTIMVRSYRKFSSPTTAFDHITSCRSASCHCMLSRTKATAHGFQSRGHIVHDPVRMNTVMQMRLSLESQSRRVSMVEISSRTSCILRVFAEQDPSTPRDRSPGYRAFSGTRYLEPGQKAAAQVQR